MLFKLFYMEEVSMKKLLLVLMLVFASSAQASSGFCIKQFLKDNANVRLQPGGPTAFVPSQQSSGSAQGSSGVYSGN